MEYFKDIPGYEGFYRASDKGQIFSVRRQRLMSLVKNKDGYMTVIFRVNKREQSFTVHRLVLLTFEGPRPEGKVINHKNFIRSDNRLENLEYVTQTENVKFSHANGRHVKNLPYRDDRFTEDDVRLIRNCANTDEELAQYFSTKRSFINKIRRHKAYVWVK